MCPAASWAEWVTFEGLLLGTVAVKGGGVRGSLVGLGLASGRRAPPHRLWTLGVVVAITVGVWFDLWLSR